MEHDPSDPDTPTMEGDSLLSDAPITNDLTSSLNTSSKEDDHPVPDTPTIDDRVPNTDATIMVGAQKPFPFLGLPKELRMMVYEELMDNNKNRVTFTSPKGLEVEEVYIDEMHHPRLLEINKLIREEYWPLCLRTATLWIIYGCPELTRSGPEEDMDEENEPTLPPLSEWLKLSKVVLAKMPNVVFKFGATWELPKINPFYGIADCTSELLSLERMGIWSEIDMTIVEFSPDQEERDMWFQILVENIFEEEFALLDIQEEQGRVFDTRADCSMYTTLFEMNKKFHWPRRRHLVQGVAPLAGLPEWGYSMFTVLPEWRRPTKGSFMYHGEEVVFDRVEHGLPVRDRAEDCDSPSEFDYEYDEAGWATGSPGWD
ncbi:hypothetical protein E4T43_04532 [Aureobasidium subglaciale]|nr:hypothetical protein E4T43_04532 [Aureobasidium subglaciale]